MILSLSSRQSRLHGKVQFTPPAGRSDLCRQYENFEFQQYLFVEMGGLEPPSRHRTRQLSTRLVFLWLSAGRCRKTGQCQLILYVLAGFKGIPLCIRFG